MRIDADEVGHRVVLLVGPADVLGLLAVLHRHAGVLGVEFGRLDHDLLGVGDGTQCEVDLDGLLRLAAHRLDELVGLLAGGGEPLAEVDALSLELLDRALHALVQVGVDHRLRGLDRRRARRAPR